MRQIARAFPHLVSCVAGIAMLAGACGRQVIPNELSGGGSGQSCAQAHCCTTLGEICLGRDDLNAFCQVPPTAGAACNRAASSDLPGVSIEFPDDRCSYSLADVEAGIDIKYSVVVANTLTDITPRALDASRCAQPDVEFGLTPLAKLTGPSQSYCECDLGLCLRDGAAAPTTEVPAGRYNRSMPWVGRSWGGPSDTNQPLGEAFVPGTYTFNVTAQGRWSGAGGESERAFAISAERLITLTR